MPRGEDMIASLMLLSSSTCSAQRCLCSAVVWVHRQAAEAAAAGVRDPGGRQAPGPPVPLQRVHPPQQLLQRCCCDRCDSVRLCSNTERCWRLLLVFSLHSNSSAQAKTDVRQEVMSRRCLLRAATALTSSCTRLSHGSLLTQIFNTGHPKNSVFYGREIPNRIHVSLPNAAPMYCLCTLLQLAM
jgi:hypothetical protein